MSPDDLTTHEVLGALSGRLVHNLSNYMAALSGNLWLLNSPDVKEEQRSSALTGAQESTRRAAELLDHFGNLVKTTHTNANLSPVSVLAINLTSWRPDWQITIAPWVAKSPYYLAGPWKSLKFCLDAIADEYAGAAGALKADLTAFSKTLRPHGSVKPVDYLKIEMITTGHASIRWQDHRASLANWKLTAAYELLANLGARPETIPTETGLQSTTIVFPLVAPASPAGLLPAQ
jgi:hypothetical protein